MVEVPVVRPEVTLQYLIFDFGKREASVDSAKEEKLAAGADVIQVNQALAFRVASAYYQLVTAQERLQAAQDTLRTAQTTQDAAENRLNNGLATLPDVLNARAETSQAVFDEESADGDEKIARVTLTEAVGADPSPDIVIDSQRSAPLPEKPHNVHRGADRSRDEESSRTHGASSANPLRRGSAFVQPRQSTNRRSFSRDRLRRPLCGPRRITASSAPRASLPGPSTLGIHWRIFDGGVRKNELLIAESKRREAAGRTYDER